MLNCLVFVAIEQSTAEERLTLGHSWFLCPKPTMAEKPSFYAYFHPFLAMRFGLRALFGFIHVGKEARKQDIRLSLNDPAALYKASVIRMLLTNG